MPAVIELSFLVVPGTSPKQLSRHEAIVAVPIVVWGSAKYRYARSVKRLTRLAFLARGFVRAIGSPGRPQLPARVGLRA